MNTKDWWKNAVIYQVYPRSFQDTNGDGIGDIQGIIYRLDYLQDLGINALWLSPVYASPNKDNGYDVSDYFSIMEEFGTMDQMDSLIAEAKKRNIAIIMDLVTNHTSDEHRWFQEARKSKGSPYRDYYIWRNPVDDGLPNDLMAGMSEPAWTFDEATSQYYFHLFTKNQPDLNWENPKVHQEIIDIIKFWAKKGVKGFRLDVIDLIGKVPDQMITVNGPHLHEYIHKISKGGFEKYHLMTIGETWSADVSEALKYTRPERRELNMLYTFSHVTLTENIGPDKWSFTVKELDVPRLKVVIKEWQDGLNNDSWNALFWCNHDLPRIVSHYGDAQNDRVKSAKTLAILLHMQKGTPTIYQGEEIGMTNALITDIKEARDIESLNMYELYAEQGVKKEELLAKINYKGRDNARTPMQWDDTDNGGFTMGKPWLESNPNYDTINVEEALIDSDSIYYTYKELIRLRREEEWVTSADFQLIETTDEKVIAYLRVSADKKVLVVCNLSSDERPFSYEGTIEKTILSNLPVERLSLENSTLSAWESQVLEVKL